jgi:predicted phosphohydrolase
MTIQYASDLHLEFPQNQEFLKANPLKPKGEVLILSGDIVPFVIMDKHKDFFRYVSDHFQVTWWIPGNHEYYHYDIAEKCGTLNENMLPNVHLVNNLTVQSDGVSLIFSTLWAKISPGHQWQVERKISDFQVIRYKGLDFSAEHFNQLHEESLHFLISELQRNDAGKKVVVTHHVPTLKNYPEKYKGDVLNEAFAVELFD